jgi:hypothetical protein
MHMRACAAPACHQPAPARARLELNGPLRTSSEAIAPELPRSASDDCQNLNVQQRRAGKAGS